MTTTRPRRRLRVMCALPAWSLRDIRAEDTQGIAGAWPALGLLYVAAAARAAGHQVEVRDGIFFRHDELVREIRDFAPDVVGLFVIAPFWPRAKRTLRDLRACLPGTLMVAGGHGATALGESYLAECPELDLAVLGEGEATFQEVLARYAADEPLAGIPGTLARDGDGRTVAGPPRPLIEDLDGLAFPAVDLVPLHLFEPSFGQVYRTPSVQALSSRGCVNNCLYCYKMHGRSLRLRSPENVVEEVAWYAGRYRARDIKFWDECFTYDRDRALRFCDLLARRDLGVFFWISARADMVDAELLAALKRAGCWCINFGIESAVQKNLDRLRKNLTVEQNEWAVRKAHEAGIATFTTYIFGIPGETYSEGLQTIELAVKLNSMYTEFFPITPWPGTDLWNGAHDYGRILRPVEEIGMLQSRIPFAPHTMTEDELAALLARAYSRFYLRPRYVAGRLTGVRSFYDLKVLVHGGLTLLAMKHGRKSAPSCRP